MNEPPAPTPSDESSVKGASAVFAEWKELGTGVFTAFAAILSFLVPGSTAKIIAALFTLVAVPLLVYGYAITQRRRREQDKLRVLKKNFEETAGRQAGFRGLTPYGVGERLPGMQRVREARRLVARVAGDDFRFGVLCGESGAGKSSMLRTEVLAGLEHANIQSVYISDPNGVLLNPDRSDLMLRPLIGIQSTEPAALLIDQFEEYLRVQPDPAARSQFGAVLQAALDSRPSLRILVVLRREYLVEIRDLAPGLRDPLAVPNLFYLMNFTVEEATDVILDCAQRDGLPVNPEFARSLANDLAEEGRVRPPELQLVCTYLGDRLDEEKYQEAGGTAGILSHHVQRALLLVDEPELCSRLLRALCDFSTRTRKPPQSVEALAKQVTDIAMAHSATVVLVQGTLRRLEEARLVTPANQAGGTPVYALVHDYLVEAVDIATRGITTQREEATQQLRYHLASKDQIVSPARARFIRTHADPALLATFTAKKLLRRSLLRPLLRVGGTGIAAITLAVVLYAGANAGRMWKREEVGRHWPADSSGYVTVGSFPGEKLFSEGGSYFKIWEPTSGALIWSAPDGPDGRSFQVGPKGEFIIFSTPDLSSYLATHVPTGVKYPVPDSAVDLWGLPSDFNFGRSGTAITYYNNVQSPNDTLATRLIVYSLAEQKVLGTLKGTFMRSWQSDVGRIHTVPVLSAGGDRVVVLTREGPYAVPSLYDVRTGRQIGVLHAEGDTDSHTFSVNDDRGWVVTVAKSTEGGTALRLWSLRDGSLVRANDLLSAVFPFGTETSPTFSADGSHILVRKRINIFTGDSVDRKVVVGTLDLSPVLAVPQRGIVLVEAADLTVAWWAGTKELHLWNMRSNNKPVVLPISRDTGAALTVNTRGRLLFQPQNAPPELWDLQARTRIASFATQGRRLSTEFSADEHAVLVTHENDVIAVFDAQDGALLTDALPERQVESVTYRRSCRQLHVWNAGGVVSRYVEGRWFLGWFRPSRGCSPEDTISNSKR
jgi:hypothetical protein